MAGSQAVADSSAWSRGPASQVQVSNRPTEGSELLARALQHETDHLDGVLFLDRLDPAAREAAVAEIAAAGWSDRPPPVVKLSPHPTGPLQ